MKKLLLFITALTLSMGLWAETMDGVKYLDANGVEQTANGVNIISQDVTQVPVTLGTAGQTTWYVVISEKRVGFSHGAICQGDVRLILADGNKLVAGGENRQAGMQVSGEGNSLTIYGQANSSGQLNATGGQYAAGIGGGSGGDGSNITINGGDVRATGGERAAGIGGGATGSGYNITINRGLVTANGQNFASGIGGGQGGSGSNILVDTLMQVKAGNNNPPASVIENNGSDLASSLAGKQYVTIIFDALHDVRAAALAEINAAIQDLTLFPQEEEYINTLMMYIREGDDEDLIKKDKILTLSYIALHDTKVAAIAELKHDMGDYAESEAIYNLIGGTAIEAAINADKITEAKNAAMIKLEEYSVVLGDAGIVGYNKGIQDGKAETLGDMGTPCTDCTAVQVTKGTTTVTLYAPESVKYVKVVEN